MTSRKILLISDIHSQRITLRKILNKVKDEPIFACFVTGDISNHGTKRELVEILKEIKKHVPKVFFVLGNCDPIFSLTSEEERELEVSRIYWVKRPIELENFILIGFNGTRINPLKAEINLPDNKPICILTHVPPFNTLADSVSPVRHIGSRELRLFIEKNDTIFLNVCGHVHEAPSVSKLNRATIVNPGSVTLGNFAIINITADLAIKTELMSIYNV